MHRRQAVSGDVVCAWHRWQCQVLEGGRRFSLGRVWVQKAVLSSESSCPPPNPSSSGRKTSGASRRCTPPIRW